MGFFSVLDREGEDADFSIEDCHLNCWVLGGLPWRNNFFFDVGLCVKVNSGELGGLRLALPFYTDQDDLKDLEDKLDRQVLWLIFSRRTGGVREKSDPNHDTVSYPGDRRVNLLGVDVDKSNQQVARKDFSVWDLNFRNPLSYNDNHEGRGYFRVRFHTGKMSNVWTWKRLGGLFLPNGARFECRVSDTRDVLDSYSLHKSYIKHSKCIEDVYLFLITHSSLTPDIVSPDLHYARMYEGKSWEKYLGMRPYLYGNDKITIYQWRDEDEATSLDNPFRVFMDMSRDNGYVPLKNYVLASIILFFIWITYELFTGNLLSGLPEVNLFLGFLPVAAAFASVILNIPPHRLPSFIKRSALWIEKKLLRPHSDL